MGNTRSDDEMEPRGSSKEWILNIAFNRW